MSVPQVRGIRARPARRGDGIAKHVRQTRQLWQPVAHVSAAPAAHKQAILGGDKRAKTVPLHLEAVVAARDLSGLASIGSARPSVQPRRPLAWRVRLLAERVVTVDGSFTRLLSSKMRSDGAGGLTPSIPTTAGRRTTPLKAIAM